MSLYARPVESDPEIDPTKPQARRSDPFRVLRTHRNFRLFWTGQTASLIGTWMQTMAVGWLSLELSNSAFVVGLVASMGALPVVLFSMHAGALVDRGNKLRIVRITQTLFLLQALVLFGVTLGGQVTVGLLLGLSLVQGCLSAVEIPARQSLIIQLVGREDLQPAIALNSSGFNLARVVGPAVGGAVIGKLGIAWCFGLNALSFGWVLWGLARIRTANSEAANSDNGRSAAVGFETANRDSRATEAFAAEAITAAALTAGTAVGASGVEAAEHAGFRREGSRGLLFRCALSVNGYRSFQTILRQTSTDARDGLRYLALPGPVRELLLLVTIGAILGGPFIALMPVVARDQLGLGAQGYGALLAMVGIGGLIGALLVAGPVSHKPNKGRVLIGAALAFPLLLLAFAFTRTPWLANVLLLLTGMAMIMFNSLSNGVLQLLVDERYRGRLMAFYSLVFVGLSQAVGALALGALARLIGGAEAIAACALVLAGASGVAWKRGMFWRVV
jgi:MFS family permease